MAEVAKLLGVEIGEEFEISNNGNAVVKLTKSGLEIVSCLGPLIDNAESVCLRNLLTGGYIIKRKPWKPKDNDHYYRINECGNVECDEWLSFGEDIVWYKLGNCYRTKEEAEANRDKWLAFYASDEVLEV